MAKIKKKEESPEYKGFIVYFNVFGSLFERKSNEIIGKTMKMVYMFARYGKLPAEAELTDGIELVWDGYLETVEYDRTSYYESCRLGAWGNEVKRLNAAGEEVTEEKKNEFFNGYDEKHRADYMKTTLYKDYLESIKANEELKVKLAEAREEGRAAAKAEQKTLTAENLPPVPHAAKEPKKPDTELRQ